MWILFLWFYDILFLVSGRKCLCTGNCLDCYWSMEENIQTTHFFFLFSLLIFNFKNGGGVVFRSKNTRHCDTQQENVS